MIWKIDEKIIRKKRNTSTYVFLFQREKNWNLNLKTNHRRYEKENAQNVGESTPLALVTCNKNASRLKSKAQKHTRKRMLSMVPRQEQTKHSRHNKKN